MYKATQFVFSAVLLVLVFTNVSFAKEWIPLDSSLDPSPPEVALIESNNSETVIEYALPGFTSEPIVYDGTEYKSLRLPGCWTTLEVGKPQLPVINELIAVPKGASLDVSVVHSESVVLGNYNVYPFQKPLRQTESRLHFDIDEPFYYTQSDSYPAEIAVTDAPGIWRSLRVVKLTVQPFQFNPATNELTVYTNLTVRLSYEGGLGYEVTQNMPITPAYDRIYSSSILNYDMLQFPINNINMRAYDLLIIAADDYVDNMAPFVSWKNAKGISTQIVSMSTVGSSVADIKGYLSLELSDNNISYVLMVGNETDIPMYTGYGFVSDYYYTLLAGGDDYADIAIGRFCVHSETDCDTMVSKSIAFEQNPPSADLMDNTVLVANWEDAPDKYQGCKETIRTATYNFMTPDFTTQYGASVANGGNEATNADVIASIDAGQRVVNYRGHGSETAWTYWNTSGEYFDLSDVAALNNGAMTPVIFGIACLNADLSHPTNTLAEAFTLDSEGAVAYLGASDPSFTTPNHTYDQQLYLSTYNDGVASIGDISNIAATRIIIDHGSTGLENAQMYLWLGDPTLELFGYANQPPTADAGGPYYGVVGSKLVFDASGSFDPDGTIVLYEWDFDNDGVWDASSTLPEINYTYTAPHMGVCRLRVTDDGNLTAEDTADVEVKMPTAAVFSSDKNITLKETGGGYFMLRDEDLARVDVATKMLEPYFDGTDLALSSLDAVDLVMIDGGHMVHTDLYFSVNENHLVGGMNNPHVYAHKADVLKLSMTGNNLSIYFDGSSYGIQSLDAVSILEDGSVVFSPGADFMYGLNWFRDEDLVLCDPSTGYLWPYLTGQDIGVNTLDAVDVLYEWVYFSVSQAAYVTKPPLWLYLKPGDIGLYNMNTDTLEFFMRGSPYAVGLLDAIALDGLIQ